MRNFTKTKIKEVLPLKSFSYAFYIILAVIHSALQIFFAFAVKNLINAVEYKTNGTGIFICSLILVAVVILSFVLGASIRFLSNKIQLNFELKLKREVFDSYINSSYEKLSEISGGDLISRLEGDVSSVSSVRTNLYPQIIATAVRLIGTVIALMLLQPLFTLIALITAIIIVISSYFIRKIVYKLHKKSRIESSNQANAVNEVSKNALLIKTVNAEEFFSKRANYAFENYKNAKLTKNNFNAIVSSTINLIFTAFYALAVIFGAYGIYNSVDGINFGVITALLQLILQVKSPIVSVSGFFTAHAEMLSSGERLFELSNGEDINLIPVDDFDLIRFENVSFSYGGEEVIKNLSFEIKKGENLVIKGASGEGKTTLIKLLTGVYSATKGKITVIIKGCEFSPKDIKNLYAFSPQDSSRFSGSVKENVVFNNEYDEELINTTLKTACLQGVVDENSTSELSQGETQRLSIARALYARLKITVLDEPTSALDEETEKSIVKNLSDYKQTTFIVITHKPAFDEFGKVITLKGGEII